MGSKAWDDAVNGGSNDVTSQSLLKEIKRLYDTSYGYQTQAGNLPTGLGFDYGRYADLNNAAITASHQATKLKQLLGLVDQGSASSSSNPFGTGGSGSGGSGAPTVNTSNRFEAGLSDAELRLKNLLDNPDSVQQSAAYKFRVGQGQEALQRSLGAKGLLNSGNRLIELTKYGQDMASQEYDSQAGRLGNLLGNYSQSWIGDKNANTSLFNAQANAWNQAQANADRTKLAWAEFNKPQYASVRGGGGGGGSTAGLYDQTPHNFDTDPTFQKMARDSGWNYDYSQGGQSLWKNTATGESAWSAGGREGNPTQTQFYGTPAWDRNNARRA